MNKHILIIEERNVARISAVKNVERFNENEILVYTHCGDLLIKGSRLEVHQCSSQGEVEVTGQINSACYISEKYHVPDNFLSRLFK